MPKRPLLLSCSLVLLSLASQAQDTSKAWIAKSNHYTQQLIDLEKKYSPEYGSSQGLAEYDTLVSVPTLANEIAQRKEQELAMTDLRNALTTETHPAVRQDLNILMTRMKLTFKSQDYAMYKQVPFLNASSLIYGGLQPLLDDQTPAERRQSAVIRLRKYVGLQPGYRPIAAILKERVQLQMNKKDMTYPSRQEMEVEMSRNESYVSGIAELFKKYKITGWEPAYNELRKQLKEYDSWTKKNVLSKARKDFKLAPEEYALQLEEFGIDIAPVQLAAMAHTAFTAVQEEMKPIAEKIARQRGWMDTDYRSVIRELKKEQVFGDSIIPLYERHLKDIEGIIRDKNILTLPDRPAIIRLATEAETARSPAPHMVPPPFLNNTGQRGVFVLPMNMPAAAGKSVDKYDDFTFDAACWTLIAHEARPGHELQFDKMVEEGVSQARTLYAFNSTNVEGWGLYSEYLIRPYMPLEGQLISLDYLLLRAARAFLDPELQSGKITQQHVLDVLMDDVVQSKAMATQEMQRYSIKMPGQANSYFYGYTRMIGLRKDAEKALGNKFDALKFHNFILSQGLLPPALIRDAVMNTFVPSQQ
jgi:hypothetical protein